MKNLAQQRIRAIVALVVFVTLGLTQLLSAYASSILFVAPTGNDANSCLTMASACQTIGAAVSKAFAGDTVIIATGVYTESIGIDKDLTLIGFGPDATIINQGRIIVTTATVRIYDMTIMHGGSIQDGGALYNDRGDVTLTYVSVLSSHAEYDGGGIYNYQGTLTLDNTIVVGNSAVKDAGGIYSYAGQVLLSHTIVQSNSACNTACTNIPTRNPPGNKLDNGFLSFGGGIENDAGIMIIEASAIISNSSVSGGDGIYNAGTLVITNTTISDNAGVAFGLQNESVVIMTNVTLSGNKTNLRSIK